VHLLDLDLGLPLELPHLALQVADLVASIAQLAFKLADLLLLVNKELLVALIPYRPCQGSLVYLLVLLLVALR